MNKLYAIITLLILSISAQAQVGIGTPNPNASAALEIKDTAKGLLIPRMKMNQRNSINNPSEGLMVYQTDSTKGFWYYDGGQWRNINYGNYGGKQTIVLSDTISNAQAQAKLLAEYGVNTQSIRVVGCANLTTLDLSVVTTATDVYISDNSLLQTVNASNLSRCDGSFKVLNCPALTSINLSSLEKIIAGANEEALVFQNTKLNSVSISNLKKLIGYLVVKDNSNMTSFSLPALFDGTINRIEVSGNNTLNSLSLPLISKITSDLTINNNSSLATFTVSALSTIGWLEINNNTALTSLSLPSLTGMLSTNSSSITNCQNMTAISLGNLSTFNNEGLFITDDRLPSSKINYILSKLVGISPNLTGKNISLNQIVSAPPTGQGVTDKATLISRGNNVYTD